MPDPFGLHSAIHAIIINKFGQTSSRVRPLKGRIGMLERGANYHSLVRREIEAVTFKDEEIEIA